MKIRLRIHETPMSRLRAYHLAPGKQAEALSYVWGQAVNVGKELIILVPHNAKVWPLAPDCFASQSAGNVRLEPEVLNGMLIKFAESHFNCLINVHDHWFDDYTRFSGIDDCDDIEFDHYLRSSFEPMLVKHHHIGPARSIYNVSVVLAQKGLDTRLVDTRRQSHFSSLAAVDVVGEHFERIVPSKPTMDSFSGEVFSRQRDFITSDRQALLGEMNVALVGCGGLGSILAESLGRIGIGGVTLIDDDRIDISNLNRWQGGTPRAVGKAKAAVLAARLRRMFPHMRVKRLSKSVFDPSVEPALATCDVIVAGLDNDEARYFMNRFSIQYSIPYFDAGVAVTGSDETTDFHSRFFAVLPGTTACAECTQYSLFDREKTLVAFLDEATAKSRRIAGYVIDQPQMATPSVYALNQRAASLLVTELLNYVCSWRPTATMVSESWRDGAVQRADRENFPEGPDPECPVCGFYSGTGNTEPLPRPRAFDSVSPTDESGSRPH